MSFPMRLAVYVVPFVALALVPESAQAQCAKGGRGGGGGNFPGMSRFGGGGGFNSYQPMAFTGYGNRFQGMNPYAGMMGMPGYSRGEPRGVSPRSRNYVLQQQAYAYSLYAAAYGVGPLAGAGFPAMAGGGGAGFPAMAGFGGGFAGGGADAAAAALGGFGAGGVAGGAGFGLR